MMSLGPIAAPNRQPVIEKDFEKVCRITVRDSMPGSETIDLDGVSGFDKRLGTFLHLETASFQNEKAAK
jgi:hypothetical protein